ncbi:Lipopolysaccharide assembly protein B [bacterium HR39]|nr:Lipopolysaccharide assembly protein B [bacterium HR39]
MLRLFAFILLTVVAAAAAAWFADNPGRVVVDWLGVEIETTVGIVVLFALVFAALSVGLFEFARFLLTLPRRIAERRRARREREGRQALSMGLVAAAAGDVGAARHYARQARRLLDDSDPAILLLTAQTAQLEGDELAALRYFQSMLHHPETELLGLRGLLAQAVKAGDLEEALRLARRAHRRSPKTPWVVTTLFDLLTRAGAWDEAMQVLGELQQLGLVDAETAARRRAILLVTMAERAEKEGRTADAFAHARRAARTAPFFAPATVLAARHAQRLGRPRLARRLIERAWRTAPHPDLAKAWIGLQPEEPLAQRIQRLERLRALQPFHPLPYMLLAEACMAAGDFGEAHRLLVRARELEPTERVYRLFAELARLRGEPEDIVRSWLERAREAPPDPAWVDEDTGSVLPAWQPFGRCGRFDAVQWRTPSRVVQLAPGAEGVEFLAAPRPSPAREVVPREEAKPPVRREAVGTGAEPGERGDGGEQPAEAEDGAERRPGSAAA